MKARHGRKHQEKLSKIEHGTEAGQVSTRNLVAVGDHIAGMGKGTRDGNDQIDSINGQERHSERVGTRERNWVRRGVSVYIYNYANAGKDRQRACNGKPNPHHNSRKSSRFALSHIYSKVACERKHLKPHGREQYASLFEIWAICHAQKQHGTNKKRICLRCDVN
jgi:hypothetical protein